MIAYCSYGEVIDYNDPNYTCARRRKPVTVGRVKRRRTSPLCYGETQEDFLAKRRERERNREIRKREWTASDRRFRRKVIRGRLK
jgi:hypothetical protein